METITKKSKVYASCDFESGREFDKFTYPNKQVIIDQFEPLLLYHLKREITRIYKKAHISNVKIEKMILDEDTNHYILKGLQLSFIIDPNGENIQLTKETNGYVVAGVLGLVTIITIAVSTVLGLTVVSINIDKMIPLTKNVSYIIFGIIGLYLLTILAGSDKK